MNNEIENFFAAATSNRFAPVTASPFLGVIAYVMGFFFIPEGFEADPTVIAESAAVDAGVTEAEMAAWIKANEAKIAKAFALIGDVQGAREENWYEQRARLTGKSVDEVIDAAIAHKKRFKHEGY